MLRIELEAEVQREEGIEAWVLYGGGGRRLSIGVLVSLFSVDCEILEQ